MSHLPQVRYGDASNGVFDGVSPAERDALHDVDLGMERLHRAHGHLVAFHHNTGRAMNHLAAAEQGLREAGRSDLADRLRDEYLARGVASAPDSTHPVDGLWSYAILEGFQEVFLDGILAFGQEVHADVANGHRHLNERQQERRWKRRAGRP